MKPSLFLSLLPFLAACSAPSPGIQVTPEAQSSLKVGVSTVTQVQTNIGAPTTRMVGADGDETWFYMYNKNDINPAAFVPLVGSAVALMSQNEIDNEALTLTFRNQILTSCKFVMTSGTSAAMIGNSGPTQASTVEKKCG